VHRGRDALVCQLDSHSTVIADLRKQLEVQHGVPAQSFRLMARGKVLDDAASVPEAKIMMLQRPPEMNREHVLRVRCLVTGRILKGYIASAKMGIGELTRRVAVALKLDEEPRALYVERGKQLLRPDLSLSDYELDTTHELYICPAPALPKAQKDVDSEGSEPTQQPRPQSLNLPNGQVHRNAPDALHACTESKCPNNSVKSAVALEAPNDRKTGKSDGHASSVGVPLQVRTGVLSGVDSIGRGPSRAALREGLEAIERELLSAVAKSSPSSSAATDGAPDMTGAASTEMLKRLLTTAVEGGAIGFTEGDVARDAERQQAHIEDICTKLVRDLRRDPPPPEKPRDVRAAKQEQASWGKGLSKGFLTKPRKKRKAAPTATKENTGASSALVGATPKRPSWSCCVACAARLPVTAAVQARCRCGDLYCPSHMHAHRCKFDYKAAHATRLRDNNPKIEPAKLESL